MLDHTQRIDRYIAQTGRRWPTARQRRRIDHKFGHQANQVQMSDGTKVTPRRVDVLRARPGGFLTRPAS